MICYLDTTFCISPNCTNKCKRKLTKEIEEAGEKWWKQIQGKDYKSNTCPFACSNFCDR